MVSRTYKIIRSCNRAVRSQEYMQSGLTWDAAQARCAELNQTEAEAYPLETSWTRDLYYPELEKEEAK